MRSRDWRVDTLRGYFLVLMTFTHLPRHPLERFSSYTFGFASAPDGFVFLSGLVSAWVYLRIRGLRGQAAMQARVLQRTRDIYLVHLLLLALGILGATALQQISFQGIHPFQAFLAGALLLYQPGYCDILPMYCVFLLFTPLVLDQMMKGRAWLVGLISALLWLTAQQGFGDATKNVPWIYLGGFNLLAWQAYFIAGQYLGSRKLRGQEAVPRSRALLLMCIALALFFFVDRHLEFITGLTPPLKFLAGTGRNPARFLDAACLAYILWWLPRSLDHKLIRFRVFRFMNLLGRHSLHVFVFSLFVTAPWSEAGLPYWIGLPGWAKLGITVATALSLAIPAWFHESHRLRARSQILGVQDPALAQGSPVRAT